MTVATYAVCPMCAVVLPAADFYLLTRKNNPSGLISRAGFFSAMRKYIREYGMAGEAVEAQLIPLSLLEDDFDQVENSYENLPFEESLADYQRIGYGDFLTPESME